MYRTQATASFSGEFKAPCTTRTSPIARAPPKHLQIPPAPSRPARQDALPHLVLVPENLDVLHDASQPPHPAQHKVDDGALLTARAQQRLGDEEESLHPLQHLVLHRRQLVGHRVCDPEPAPASALAEELSTPQLGGEVVPPPYV